MRWLAAVLFLAAPAQGQTAQEVARGAAAQLEAAAAQLDAAQGAGDRVAALTATIRAYEEGLAALRDGLRQIAVRQRALGDDLAAREAEIGRLIAALQGVERSAPPLLILHPSGAVDTARASMMLADVMPALQREADVLRADLDLLAELRILEESAAASLRAGLSGIEEARAILSDAIADRGPLPGRLAEDAQRIAALLGRVDTLQAFADGLGSLPGPAALATLAPPLPLPVAGTRLRGFREADAAGIARPGLVLATYAGALVTAPTAGTVRYAGPLLDYGNVIVLEPQPGTLLVLAGISDIYVQAGEILTQGAPIGLMGGAVPEAEDFLRQPRAGGGTSRPETLYIEFRQAGRPVDPATWFAEE
ncbi:MAG: peptidoglycan DD-metalloendopeptidase family protein [Pseudomonadota bacterium]